MQVKIGWGVVLIILLLIILKVFGIAPIPWLWCFCPIWIPISLGLIAYIAALIGIVVCVIIRLISDFYRQ
jgi:hypothetical protein